MNGLDSLKGYVKELYHDGIRTVGKYVVPVVLASALAFTACRSPAPPPTPIPTPTSNPIMSNLKCYTDGQPSKISWNYQNPVQCFKDDKLILKFEVSREVPIGETVSIPIFVSSEVYKGSSVPVVYSKQRCIDVPGVGLGPCADTENTEMITLANIPVNKEVTLKFKPESTGRYDFFLPGIIFLEPENRWPGKDVNRPFYSENRGVIGRVLIGRSSSISIKSDVREVSPYTSVLISGSTSPPTCLIRVEITKDGRNMKSFEIESRTGNYSVNWLPEDTGAYKVIARGVYLYECVRDHIVDSRSDPLTIVVK